MGCNCGGSTSNGWNYVAPNGQATTYPTEIEAMAAKVRAGGVGEVKKAP